MKNQLRMVKLVLTKRLEKKKQNQFLLKSYKSVCQKYTIWRYCNILLNSAPLVYDWEASRDFAVLGQFG